jgi:Fe2+ transport system protein FeoA
MTTPSRSPAPAALTLGEIGVGVDVVVDHVKGGVDATVLRLCEMGLVPGGAVTVTRRAPLGGPVEVRVRGTRLCLRQSDARRFVVAETSIVDDRGR